MPIANNPESFEYHVLKDSGINDRQRGQINFLLAQSIRMDFPGHSTNEYSHALRTMHTLSRSRQSYAHDRKILAVRDDRVEVLITTSDNASGKLPNLLGGRIEQQLKLRLDSNIERRWRKIGHRAILPALLPSTDEEFNPGSLELLDVMGYLAADEADDRQPFSVYPWGERLWSPTLSSWDLHRDEQSPLKPVQLFSIDEPLWQERYTGGVDDVKSAILAKDGAEKIINTLIINRRSKHS
jgi:hypothetical protein